MTTEEAVKALKWKVEYAKEIGESYIDCVYVEALDTIIKALEERSQGKLKNEIAKDKKPKGEWNSIIKANYGDNVFNCNNCYATFTVTEGANKMHFCPNCGADMRGNKK